MILPEAKEAGRKLEADDVLECVCVRKKQGLRGCSSPPGNDTNAHKGCSHKLRAEELVGGAGAVQTVEEGGVSWVGPPPPRGDWAPDVGGGVALFAREKIVVVGLSHVALSKFCQVRFESQKLLSKAFSDSPDSPLVMVPSAGRNSRRTPMALE